VPELPEVETVRADLDRFIVGRTIECVTLGRLRSVRRYANPQTFIDELLGAHITSTGRLGKYLFINLGNTANGATEHVLVVHLRMSGQLLLPEGGARAPLADHTHVRIGFDNDSELRFVDPRTFGEMFVTVPSLPELAKMGPDAWTGLVDAEQLRTRITGKRALKAVLLDQTVVAGIGSIYADEICHRAGVRPGRSVDKLKKVDFQRLFEATREVLGAAIVARGSTLGDGQYVGLDGQAGSFAEQHCVHARIAKGCGTCDGPIKTGTIAQRSAYWCPACQK
jgi:formamidopyrimidine-DNA glycosylase